MDKKELLAKENEFIKLRNEGKSLKEITEALQLSPELINKWDLAIKKALEEMPKLSPLRVEVSGKDEDNQYVFRNTLSFQVSFLEAIKLKLWQFATSQISNSTDLSPGQIDLYNNLINQAQKHHATVSKYVTDADLEVDSKTNAFNIQYHSISEDPAILQLINDALSFYLQYIHYPEAAPKYSLFQKYSEDIFHPISLSHNTPLPVALKKVHVKNYHGIAQTCIEDIPVDTQWIFLTGENGYGKTTFLQAIAIGFLGNKDGENILVDDQKTRISIEFKYNGQDTIRHLGLPLPPMTYLAAYGSARLEIQNAQSQSRVEEHMAISYSLFNTDGVLQNIEFELYKWSLKGDKKFNAVKKLFKQLIPQLHDIKVDKERDEVLYIEKDAHGKAFEAVPFRKLASGFRSIIAMIGDMVIRLYKRQPEITNPQELSGIVLIDEFDLHLHPKWQRELPVLLSAAFPLVQFIVSTHSVIPFLGAPPNSVFLKVTRDRKKGIQVEKLDIDIKNLLPNTILTSAIFDMDSITQRNNEEVSEVRTEDNFNEVLENDEVREKLKQFEESDADFPSDLFNQA